MSPQHYMMSTGLDCRAGKNITSIKINTNQCYLNPLIPIDYGVKQGGVMSPALKVANKYMDVFIYVHINDFEL